MKVTDNQLRDLGQQMTNAAAEDAYLDELTEQRQLFVDSPSILRTGFVFTRPVFGGAIAAAAAVVIAVALFISSGDNQVPFWVGPTGVTGAEGSWVEAHASKRTSIRFAGGSLFYLYRGGAARVIESNDKQVMIDLASGKLQCSVEGNGTTRWVVRAGAYRVVVTGTKFTVDWAANTSDLTVVVKEGSVYVSGETLNVHGVSLAKGERLRVNNGEIVILKKNTATEPNATQRERKTEKIVISLEAEQAAALEVAKDEDALASKPTLSTTRSRGDASSQGWKTQLKEKDYTGAIATAKLYGLDRLASRVPAKELWQLSVAARTIRDGRSAKTLLQAMNTRFPGTSKARSSIFLLGRVNEELLGDYDAAQKWYKKYVDMGPNNALSEEALGRLFELCQRKGWSQKARNHARTYLSKYPQGPFAERARFVLR